MSILSRKTDPNEQVNYYHRGARIVRLTFVVFLIIIGIWTTYFVYTNVSQAFSDSYMIISIIPKTEMDAIDVVAFDESEKALQTKLQQPTVPTDIRNIFSYIQISTSSASSTPVL